VLSRIGLIHARSVPSERIDNKRTGRSRVGAPPMFAGTNRGSRKAWPGKTASARSKFETFTSSDSGKAAKFLRGVLRDVRRSSRTHTGQASPNVQEW
jgi:hypothetical protein